MLPLILFDILYLSFWYNSLSIFLDGE